jgi:HlyD family secretion protein
VPTLPASFLRLRDGKAGVVVDRDGRARWQEVTVGLRGREVVEITAGLSPGDTVVGGSVREGRRIRAE